MQSHTQLRRLLILIIILLCTFAARSSSSNKPAQVPATESAHFHHLHLNTTDPAGAIKFYTTKFNCEQREFLGREAVWAQQSWLLFNKVAKPPPWQLTSAIWHFGWGAEDMKAAYQKQLELGTKFFTPLTDISNIFGGNSSGRFFYAYVETPDHGLVELNTSSNHQFGHLHLFSEDPIGAGEWYVKHFGIPRRNLGPPSREPRFYRGFQIGPSSSLMMDNVNIIIYPIQYSRKAYADHWPQGQTAISPTKDRVVDHIAFSVNNLAETIKKLTKDGVKITEPIKVTEGGKLRHAFIEGPDYIRIELVEGRAQEHGSEILKPENSLLIQRQP
jgi:catechol 2,3-dioxygenase-like lactoylglutathione lyase family enzyme